MNDQYINCLGREYDDTDARYMFVCFNISRYGKHIHTIWFQNPATEREAVCAASEYLNAPMTADHFNVIRDDLFDRTPSLSDYVLRGDALGDCRFLEVCVDRLSPTGQLGVMLECGS